MAANLLLFAISLAGILTIRGVPQELVPETSPSILTVRTVWPGSGASVIEASVLSPMEEALRDVGGIRETAGGKLRLEWQGRGWPAKLAGPTHCVYTGRIEL